MIRPQKGAQNEGCHGRFQAVNRGHSAASVDTRMSPISRFGVHADDKQIDAIRRPYFLR